MKNYNWDKFAEKTRNRQPNTILIEAVEKSNFSKGLALDLGCGSGADARFLAKKDFKVEGVDYNKKSIEIAKNICKGLPVNLICEDIYKYNIEKNLYSIIIAWNSISFLNKEKAMRVFKKIEKGLKKDGLFIFSFFGPEDGWVKRKNMSFWSAEEIKKQFKKLDFVKVIEFKEEKRSVLGYLKFWHQIQGIGRKF